MRGGREPGTEMAIYAEPKSPLAKRVPGVACPGGVNWAHHRRPFLPRWIGGRRGSGGPGGEPGHRKTKEGGRAAFGGWCHPPQRAEAREMSLDRRRQRASVRSLVTAYESRWGPPGCGCCRLPAPRPRQRGCCTPPSRDASPARPRKPTTASPTAPRKLNSCGQTEADQRLVSLLLVLHSGTNSSMIAIDNKIEQAMDLVKSHLMFAVREEVEVLREQIKELSERNAALERENSLLRSLANPEQGGPAQAPRRENKPPGGSA